MNTRYQNKIQLTTRKNEGYEPWAHAEALVDAWIREGYPAAYEKGFPLTIGEDVRERVYVAGAKWKDGVLVTNGGRVLGCTAVADTLEDAIRDAYAITGQIHFENAFFRHDIGQRALKAKEI